MRATRFSVLALWGYILPHTSAQLPGAGPQGPRARSESECPDVRAREGAALLQVRGHLAKENVFEDAGVGPARHPAVQRPQLVEALAPSPMGTGDVHVGVTKGQVVTVPLASQRTAAQPQSQVQKGLAVLLQAGVQTLEPDAMRRAVFHGLVLGTIYGLLHIVAPDHLGTLLTLGASAECPSRAFAMGAWWGFGHCLGMVAMAGVFLVMGHLAHGVVEQWEHYGDYAIGLSMCLLGLYFAANESAHFETKPDGTSALMRCVCHPAGGAGVLLLHTRAPDKPKEAADGEADEEPTKFKWTVCPRCSEASAYGAALRAAQQAEGPAPPQGAWGSVLLGIFQGVCCPAGLVGLSFMADLTGLGLVCFSVIFSMVSIVGTGLVAMSWSCLGWLGCGVNMSQVWMYRVSYVFTFLLGVCWLWATYYGLVDQLDYTESISGTTTV